MLAAEAVKRDWFAGAAAVLAGLLLFFLANGFRRPMVSPEMQLSVAAPVPMQVLAAFGDRYLAANGAVWRVLMTGGGKMPRESLAALAQIQEDASFLNPGHEDNYVTATGLQPWEGFVQPTQVILRRATETRLSDPYAPFFLGFNQIHFLGDARGAYEYGMVAASHAGDDETRQALTVIAAAWLERGNDPESAKRVIEVLAGELRDPQLKEHLLQRARREEIMAELQRHIDQYVDRYGSHPKRLEELLSAGLIARIPRDPLGMVDFVVSPSGRITFQPKTGNAGETH